MAGSRKLLGKIVSCGLLHRSVMSRVLTKHHFFRMLLPLQDFPQVNFSDVGSEDDMLWTLEHETQDAAERRAALAIQGVLDREERVLAVVSHGEFLAKCIASEQNAALVEVPVELHFPQYGNAEVRVGTINCRTGQEQLA
eukprot:2100133-Amphidinium_carterae.1